MHKQNFKIILSFLFIIISNSIFSQKKFTIVLDAGHGGSDMGAYRNHPDIGLVVEKEITLAIVLKLGAMLEKNKDFKVVYTRKIDEYPSLTDRTNIANRSKADLFISVHVNSSPSKSATARGTETFVQGPAQNKENLEVAKQENSVIYLDEKDKETFASYDPTSPESLIALKIQQSKYLENSLIIGVFIEENFANSGRFSRGVKQDNLHILRMSAMPSVLIETGFANNYEDAQYLYSERGRQETAENIYNAIINYKKAVDRKSGAPMITTKKPEPEKPVEVALKNDFRILLMSSPTKYNDGDPALKGLNYILPIKENGQYKYYYGVTNLASVRDINLKTAKDAGFRNAFAVGFMPNQKLNTGYYTIELYTGDKLNGNSFIIQTLKEVERNKENGVFYYTYGKVYTLEDAVKLQKDIEAKGIKNTIIQKVYK